LYGKAAVAVHGAFRAASSSGGVNQHQSVFGIGHFAGGVTTALAHQLVPPMIAISLPRRFYTQILHHNYMTQRRNLRGGFIRDAFEEQLLATPQTAIGREQSLGFSVL